MNRVRHATAVLFGNSGLARVVSSWLLFVLAEYGVWIAMLVYAYAQGGATTAGVVAVAQLVPGIFVSPLLATLADRHSPIPVLVWGYAVQTAGMAVTAAALYAGGPALLAYSGAVLASTAVSVTRPAQAALTPALARSPDELTATNAVLGWLESVGIVLSGALTGVALGIGQVGLVFAAGAGCTVVAGLLLCRLRVAGIAAEDDAGAPADGVGAWGEVREGLAVLRSRAQPRLLVAMTAAEYLVIGALDLLFVIVAVSVLHQGEAWAGYLNTAYGVGGVVAGVITIGLVGRRMSRPIVFAAAALGLALAATVLSRSPALTLALLAVAGLGRSVLDTATSTLLQRSVPPHQLGRIFGVVEALMSAGLALGSLYVPLLTRLGGPDVALLGTAAVVPLVVLLGARTIHTLDDEARVPIVEIALLRSMPHFRALPTPEMEGLAGALERRTVAGGEVIIRQGDPGDQFYAIADGRVAVWIDGDRVATRQRPDGLGEIALLKNVPRSATVIADGPVVLYALSGAQFLTVVTGHDPTRRRAAAAAAPRLDADPDPAR
jgi:MFS family permease